MWRTYIKPCFKQMYNKAHQQDYDVFIHSCGNVSLLLDDLIEIDVDVLNPFQPEVMDIEDVMARYSWKLAYYGSISIQKNTPVRYPRRSDPGSGTLAFSGREIWRAHPITLP